MLPSLPGTKLRWQRSTRRISMVKLPTIHNQKRRNGIQTLLSTTSEEPIPPDPKPSLPDIQVITPSLSIDNRYFVNYVDAEPENDDVEYLTKAFRSFSKIHGDLNKRRRNYFEKRGLENAIQLNISQQNDRIGQAIECLAVCEQITEKYNCSLKNSFSILVEEFASKCFKLVSVTSQLNARRQTHSANLIVRTTEKSRITDVEWRIEREQRRIEELDEQIRKHVLNRDKNKNSEK